MWSGTPGVLCCTGLLLRIGYCVALPTQFTLLTVVPLRHRVLLGNVVRVIWTVYLTHASNIGTKRRDIELCNDEIR